MHHPRSANVWILWKIQASGKHFGVPNIFDSALSATAETQQEEAANFCRVAHPFRSAQHESPHVTETRYHHRKSPSQHVSTTVRLAPYRAPSPISRVAPKTPSRSSSEKVQQCARCHPTRYRCWLVTESDSKARPYHASASGLAIQHEATGDTHSGTAKPVHHTRNPSLGSKRPVASVSRVVDSLANGKG